MKLYKLKGLNYVVVAYCKEAAVLYCLCKKVGVTLNDLEEGDKLPDDIKPGVYDHEDEVNDLLAESLVNQYLSK